MKTAAPGKTWPKRPSKKLPCRTNSWYCSWACRNKMLRHVGLILWLPLMLSSSFVACAPPTPPVTEGQEAEANTPLERIQLTTAQLQAGQQTFESFVIQASGQVHWAQWNSDGVLLAAAQGQDAGAFAQLQQHPLWQAPLENPADADVLGRPAFYAEL